MKLYRAWLKRELRRMLLSHTDARGNVMNPAGLVRSIHELLKIVENR